MAHKETAEKSFRIILIVFLVISVGLNIYLGFFCFDSYLQNTDEIYIMESGILKNNFDFHEGEVLSFSYDFNNEESPIE